MSNYRWPCLQIITKTHFFIYFLVSSAKYKATFVHFKNLHQYAQKVCTWNVYTLFCKDTLPISYNNKEYFKLKSIILIYVVFKTWTRASRQHSKSSNGLFTKNFSGTGTYTMLKFSHWQWIGTGTRKKDTLRLLYNVPSGDQERYQNGMVSHWSQFHSHCSVKT